MSDINVSFYDVDLGKLIIERDFTNEANRMLPKVIEEFGKVTAVKEWNRYQKLSHTSNADRGNFIRQAIRTFKMSPVKMDQIRKIMVQQLRDQKAKYDKETSWPAFNKASVED